MPASLEIREIPADQTWPVRHQVMWPDRPLSFVQLPEDSSGRHFGAFLEEELVSVISLFPRGSQAQFRKFATLQAYQGQGIGSRLLQYAFEQASSQGMHAIWCHARSSASRFYHTMGMQVEGEGFVKNGLEYIKMTRNLQQV